MTPPKACCAYNWKEEKMRQEYEITQKDLDDIKDASKPVPYMVFGGREPSSPQENANRAWMRLGKKMGFDGMTVRPSNKGKRFFSAEPTVIVQMNGDQHCATRPDFINLQESPAGFGDTRDDAIKDLEAQ